MADSPALALRKGVIARLKAVSAVTDLVGTRVYAEPRANVVLPYLRWGQADPQSANTFKTRGRLVQFSVEAHTRADGGRQAAERILWQAQLALERQEAAITVTGFDLVYLNFLTSTVTRNADGKTFEGVAAFEALLDAGTF